ncbi:hypothetical protein EGW08_008847 [Elysia chlorotica]|uniref:Uncharacterized protein n=1 Tax=Elysia chlorotica TaxID=188477 RepID=A0A3S1BL79_ELYCH|nr:hypothetical protein EGW08_008847 [Elysia chlorotica]
MPRIHALENNDRPKAAAATAPSTPSSQRRAKDSLRRDGSRESHTAPPTPSHRRRASDRAKRQGGAAGGAGGGFGGVCPWQRPTSKSLTSNPRRHAASEAALDRSSPARTAAFAAAATALAPSVVSSIRQKSETDRALPPDPAQPQAARCYAHVWNRTRTLLPRSGSFVSDSRWIAFSGRSASFGDGVPRRSHCDALRAELAVGSHALHGPRPPGLGVRPRDLAEQAQDGLGLWGEDTCLVCGGLHFASSISSPFLSCGAGGSAATGGGRGASMIAAPSRNPSPGPNSHYRSHTGGSTDTDLHHRQKRLRESPNGYASETDMKLKQAALRRLEKEIESCPLCMPQVYLAARKNSRGIGQSVSASLQKTHEHASRRGSSARSLGLDRRGSASLRAATGSPASSAHTPTGSAHSLAGSTHMCSTACRLCDGRQGRGVVSTPIRTEGWAIPNNPRRVLCYEGLHSNCWVGT